MLDLICTIYGIIVFAKLAGLVTWSWWIVLAPLYLGWGTVGVLAWRSRREGL